MPITTEHEPAQQRGLTIQQMARQSGLSEHTLRYYERIGLIEPTERDLSSGHRRYAPETVAVVESLACMRGAGMSISDVRRLLRLYAGPRGVEDANELKAIYTAHAETLRREIAEMQERLAYVSGKAAFFEAMEAGDEARAQEIAASNQQLAAAVATLAKNDQRKNNSK